MLEGKTAKVNCREKLRFRPLQDGLWGSKGLSGNRYYNPWILKPCRNSLPSFRRKPESRLLQGFLDPGFRRGDDTVDIETFIF